MRRPQRRPAPSHERPHQVDNYGDIPVHRITIASAKAQIKSPLNATELLIVASQLC